MVTEEVVEEERMEVVVLITKEVAISRADVVVVHRTEGWRMRR